jgi:hypothetical protein
MKSPTGTLRFKPEFDAFLHAPVGAEESGMPLSVLSMLARLDLDPWQEAAQLAALSPESATLKMVSILGALPKRPLQSPDSLAIATRLVAMLPRPAPFASSPLRVLLTPSAGAPAQRPHAHGANLAVFLAVYLIFMVASQFFWTQILPAHGEPQRAATSSSSSLQVSPAPAAK